MKPSNFLMCCARAAHCERWAPGRYNVSGRTLIALFLLAASTEAPAADSKLRTIREYCTVMEQRIVGLAEAQASKNADMARYAADQPTADAKKFKEARDLLQTFSASLKENEEEWMRLGCAQILYLRPK